MYSDDIFTQPHGLVRFTVFILPTKPKQANDNIRKTLIKLMPPKQILVETQ